MKRQVQWLMAVILSLGLAGLANPMNGAEPGILAGKVVVTRGKKDQNTVVYLKGIQGDYKPPQEIAALDQVNKVFLPHLLPVLKGQTVRFNNRDPVVHNIHLHWEGRSMRNQSQAPHTHDDWVALRTGKYLVLCNIHTEMSAVVFVFDHPFFAVANPEFAIKDIPPGSYSLVAVRDVSGNIREQEKQVTIKGGETTEVRIQY